MRSLNYKIYKQREIVLKNHRINQTEFEKLWQNNLL